MIGRRGLMIVLSSPSGAGKSTLSKLLVENDAQVVMSVSVTTRAPRSNEVNGRDYFFVSDAEFRSMASRGELLEHAKVFDNHYGTPRDAVERSLARGCDVLFDIDWQGTQQLKQHAHDDLVSVFLLPPTMSVLKQRLTTRAQDSADVVAYRMSRAIEEISHWAEYDYVIVNDDLGDSIKRIRSILAVERIRRHRQTGLPDFVSGLRDIPTS